MTTQTLDALPVERTPTEPQQPNSDTGPKPPQGEPSPDDKALGQLRIDLASKKVEAICTSYQALRLVFAGRLKEMFDRIDAIGPLAKSDIIAAYAHRACFMCHKGCVPCDQCKGAGLAEKGRICPHCDGFGLASCGFCRGTGWTDRETVPQELLKSVAAMHIADIATELKRMHGGRVNWSLTVLRKLLPDQRRGLAEWILRLQSRVADLLDTTHLNDEQRAILTHETDQMDNIVKSLIEAGKPVM